MPSASSGASKAKMKTKAAVPSSKSRGVTASNALPGVPTASSKPPTSSRRAPLLHSRSSLQQHGATLGTGPGGAPKKQSLSAQHPRTDPLSALTHLLKLLAALPTRIGGCAYRLTPSEHALATHLVGVLDPYVCHGARALGVGLTLSSSLDSAPGAPSSSRVVPAGTLNGLVNQPTEILDAILGHVDDRRDLRSAGLTCRRLAGVVFPRHYEYRVVRCKVSDIAVWHHLAKNRALARNVRRVEIIDERSGPNGGGGGERLVVPRGIVNTNTDLENTSSSSSSSSSDSESLPVVHASPGRSSRTGLPFSLGMHAKQEKLLAAALSRMTGLTHFRWASVHAPIQLLRTVWPALMRSATSSGGRLRVVEVCDNLMFAPRRVESEESEDSEEGESEADGEADGEHDDSSDSESDAGGQVNRRTRTGRRKRALAASMLNMETVRFHSTAHAYGAAKQPELSRIAAMLHQCSNLKDLEITYISPRAQGSGISAAAALAALGTPTARARPLADELLLYGRWTHLTTLALVNLRCASPVAPSAFLSAHTALEVLHLDVAVQTAAGARGAPLQLAPGALPRLREIRANKEVINAVLECPLSDGDAGEGARPLEVVKGFKLAGSYNSSNQSSSNAVGARTVPDAIFFENLKIHAATLRRVELAGWHDMEDVRRLAACAPHLQHLDIGRRLGHNAHATRQASSGNMGGGGTAGASGPATNMVEWAELLATLPELTAMHGVRFFYEVSSVAIGGTLVVSNGAAVNTTLTSHAHGGTGSSTPSTNTMSTSGAPGVSDPPTATLTREMPAGGSGSSKPPAQMSMMDRSRMRKNDEIAGVLAWKCRKLRRVDHWEENSGKVIVLTRDHENSKDREKDRESKVRWEVRRVKYV